MSEEKKTWEQIDVDVLANLRQVTRQLQETEQHELLDLLKYTERAYVSLSEKVRAQVNNDHAADIYRRMLQEFKSSEELMGMFQELLSYAKLMNQDFVNDLIDIDKRYGIGND